MYPKKIEKDCFKPDKLSSFNFFLKFKTAQKTTVISLDYLFYTCMKNLYADRKKLLQLTKYSYKHK